MNNGTNATRIVKPAKCECELCCAPIAHCEIMPNGVPGTLTINGTEYAVSILGYLPPAPAEPVIDGYRLTKANGESHDLCLVAGRMECTCGDYEFRRAAQQERELCECKHIKAVRQLLLLPRDQCQPMPAPAYFDDGEPIWEQEKIEAAMHADDVGRCPFCRNRENYCIC